MEQSRRFGLEFVGLPVQVLLSSVAVAIGIREKFEDLERSLECPIRLLVMRIENHLSNDDLDHVAVDGEGQGLFAVKMSCQRVVKVHTV